MSEFKAQPLFAVVELFGHSRIAGAVSEQTFGGSTFVRVDVPDIVVEMRNYDVHPYAMEKRTIPAHTRSFGPSAIYSINWCDEDTAKRAAINIHHEPLKPYTVREALPDLPQEERRLLPSLVVPEAEAEAEAEEATERASHWSQQGIEEIGDPLARPRFPRAPGAPADAEDEDDGLPF